MKKKELHKPMLTKLLQKIGAKLGLTVTIEEEYGYVGQISYPSGVNRYFRATTLDLNNMAATNISADKDYAKFFMKKMGYRVIPGGKFYSDSWAQAIHSDQTIDKAWEFAKNMGLPVFLKPNSRSQGIGVTKVHTKSEFLKIFKRIAKIDNVILVEQPTEGKDYRIVVLDDKVISAYERIPLAIVGDGRSTVAQLLKKKQKEHATNGRDSTFSETDYRLLANLKRKKLTFESVILKGESVKLLDNANLSCGGDSRDVTNKMHQYYKAIAIRLTREMGLRICGVDMLITGEPDVFSDTAWHVIEINSAPGLDHYAKIGKEQEEIVEQLYTEVVIAMGKK